MTTPTDLIAQAEAALDGVTGQKWTVRGDNGRTCLLQADGQTIAHVLCGETIRNAIFMMWCRAGVPALIARIRELEGERDGARKANREMLLEVLAASGQAQDAYQAQLAAEATVATLTAQVEAMRGAGAIMPEHVIRVAAMLIDSLHCLDTEAIQIATATNASGGVDGVQVLEDAEKIIKAAAGLVATELQGIAATLTTENPNG